MDKTEICQKASEVLKAHASEIESGKLGVVDHQGWEWWTRSLLEQTRKLERLGRARSPEKQLLRVTAQENLLWGLSMAISLIHYKDPTFKEIKPLANAYLQGLIPHLKHKNITPEARALLKQEIEACKYPEDWTYHALILLDRLKQIETQLKSYPATPRLNRFLNSRIRHWRAYAVKAINTYQASGPKDDSKVNQKLAWIAQVLSVYEAAASCGQVTNSYQWNRKLEKIMDIHYRNLPVKFKKPAIASFGLLEWFGEMHLDDWGSPPRSGKTRAMLSHKELVLMGPEFAQGAIRAYERGEFHTGLMHELLHATPANKRGKYFKDRKMEKLDYALFEAAQQVFAEEVCKRAYDKQTGLKGGRERVPVLRGWPASLFTLAEHLERPAFEVSKELVEAGYCNRLGLVTKWLVGSEDSVAVERVTKTLGPVLHKAWETRWQKGSSAEARKETAKAIKALQKAQVKHEN